MASNNKRTGMAFERLVCERLRKAGYWVHFITPDERGAQPFDIVAVRHGIARAIECKTLNDSARFFPITRLEDNQIFAFERWMACGNAEPTILVMYCGDVYEIPFMQLKKDGKVDMRRVTPWQC